MQRIAQEYTLTNENIDSVIQTIEWYMKKNKSPSGDIIKLRLQAEETLTFYQKKFGESATFTFEYIAGIPKRFVMMFHGEKLKPFAEEQDEYVGGLLQMLGDVNSWQYKHHLNIVEFKIPPKPFSQLVKIGGALLAVILFTLLTQWIPQSAVSAIHQGVISPLVTVFVGILRSAACVLVFSSIVLSIINIGDIQSFRKIGKELFVGFVIFMFLGVALSSACFLPWVTFSADGGNASGSVKGLLQTIFAMIPIDPLSPFIEGNAIQVIVLAVFCGVIGSALGEKLKSVKTLLQEFYQFVACAIEKLNGLMPFFVFLVIENMLLGNDFSDLLAYKTIILLWAIGIGSQLIINSALAAVFGKSSVGRYYAQAKSPLIISLLTASSVAALPANIDTCKTKFKIRERLADLGIPICQVLFMPCSAVVMVATCIGIANITGMAVTAEWLVTMFVVAVLLAVATPPTPGATLMVYSLLFSQMVLPSEYIGIALALGLATDGLVTAVNTVSLHYLLLRVNQILEKKEIR